jgi:hypothetical protein
MDNNLIRQKILTNLLGIGWDNPYWLDEIKDEINEDSSAEIDTIYAEELMKKVNSMTTKELQNAYKTQKKETDANKNFLLLEILEEKMRSN